MPAEEPGPRSWAQAQQRQDDQDRTLLAIQQLEAALASAAPRREQAWRAGVRTALDILAETAASEARNAGLPDSLLSDIARSQPWLRNRVRGLRLHYRQLQDTIASLRDELAEPGDMPADVADLRQRLSSVLSGLRHQRARESDSPGTWTACRDGPHPRTKKTYGGWSRHSSSGRVMFLSLTRKRTSCRRGR